MNRAELLLPAGNIEKMEYAIAYGADAVYLGISDFSLRSMKAGNIITTENIKDAIDMAHKMGVKAYVTVNTFAHNKDIDKLPGFLEKIADSGADAIIFADNGVYNVLKKVVPHIPFHVSTQANTLNYESVMFWRDLGVERVILARELPLADIAEISKRVSDVELEVLIHGSMCVSYSGRCLLSDYMSSNQRKANQGYCTQPCRWKYKLVEEKRPGEYFEIMEDDKATYILNPKDLATIEYIPQLIEAGVHSFKVEGRTKSLYYAAVVAKTYKKAINNYYAGKESNILELYEELYKAGNRGFSSGFLVEKPDSSHYNYYASKGDTRVTFLATIMDKVGENKYQVLAKNQFKLNESVECISPNEHINCKIVQIETESEIVEVADTNKVVYVTLESDCGNQINNFKWAIIRSKENSNEIQTNTNLCSGSCN